MNDDTSSTPDESDGRVATDRTDGGGPARPRSPSPRPQGETVPAPGSGALGGGPSVTGDEATVAHHLPAEATRPVPTPKEGIAQVGDAPERAVQQPDAAAPPSNGRPEPRRAAPGIPSSQSGSFEATRPTPTARNGGASADMVKQSQDAPTANLRVPATNGSSHGETNGESGASAVGTGAAPPPWNRVPGQEQRPPSADDRAETVPRPRPAGGLLEDDPTEFLQGPGRPADAKKDDGASRSGRWSGVRPSRGRPPRQAALQLRRLDPWSVLKLALVLAVVLFLMWLVAVGVLYGVLDGIGVWDRLNGTYADLVSGETQNGSPLISAGRVFGLAAVVGAINSLLFAVALTVGAFVYNVSADLVGGIEVTLSERD